MADKRTVFDEHLDDLGRITGVALRGCSNRRQPVITHWSLCIAGRTQRPWSVRAFCYVERGVRLVHVDLNTDKPNILSPHDTSLLTKVQ